MAGSLLLHAAIAALALISFQHRFALPEDSPPVVPVELVTIAAKTNLRAEAPASAVLPPKPADITPAKITPATPPPAMSPPSVPVPDEPAPSAAPKPVKLATPVPVARPQLAEDKQKDAKPKDAKPEKEKFDINNVLALLDKQQPKAAASNAHIGPNAHKGIGAQTAMTMELADALRNQIAQCWSPPVGAPHASDLIVAFRLYLNPDGSVARPPQLTAASAALASGNAFTRAAAEAARRAIFTCAPYKLPANRYSDWQDIEIQFDPRQMMGDR